MESESASGTTSKTEVPRDRVLCLGGGATTLTLMSGALYTLNQAGLHTPGRAPTVISMAGAGAVVGLHYLAPKGLKTKEPFSLEALENTINFGVSDAIYETFPINYKVFTKGGPSADLFNEFWSSLPEVREAMHQSGMSDEEALLSDSLLFAGAAMCPTDVNFFSEGVCGHAPFLEGFIDFEALKHIDPNDVALEINAFCIEDHELVDFTNYKRDADGKPERDRHGRYIWQAITVDHLRAALAFPFLHPPHKLDDKHYFEGAAMQCLNEYTIEDARSIQWMLVLDPLRKTMIGKPENLWDAFALSVLMPTAGLTELGLLIIEAKNGFVKSGLAQTKEFKDLAGKVMELAYQQDRKLTPFELMVLLADRATPSELYGADFVIPDDKLRAAWGWSRSSMKDLFKIGKQAGMVLAQQMHLHSHL
jgi:NTE family protein